METAVVAFGNGKIVLSLQSNLFEYFSLQEFIKAGGIALINLRILVTPFLLYIKDEQQHQLACHVSWCSFTSTGMRCRKCQTVRRRPFGRVKFSDDDSDECDDLKSKLVSVML